MTDRQGKMTMLSEGYIPFRTKMSALTDTLKGHTLCSQIYPLHGASKSEHRLNSAVQCCYVRPTPYEDKCTINAACSLRMEKELGGLTEVWPIDR